PRALPAGPLDLPGLSQPDDIPAQLRQPAPDVLAVDLELRLARAAGADATTKPGHRLAPATETRQEVVELGQLDLRLALPGARVQHLPAPGAQARQNGPLQDGRPPRRRQRRLGADAIGSWARGAAGRGSAPPVSSHTEKSKSKRHRTNLSGKRPFPRNRLVRRL